MAFGSTPVSTTSLSQNQFPAAAVAVPNHAGGNFSATRGANPQNDSNGNETADVSVASPDGAMITIGTTTDASVTGDTAGTVSAKLRGMNKIWAGVSDLVNNLLHTNIKQVNGTPVVTGGASGLIAVGGPVASGGANADNPLKTGGVFNTTQPTVTNGQVVDGQMTARGARIVATGVDTFAVNASQAGTWNVNNVSGTVSLPTGAATSAKQPALGTAGTPSTDVISVQGVASGTPQPVSGTVTANAGTNLNTAALALESGGNLASILTQVTNHTVQPGNTPNTTPWVVTQVDGQKASYSASISGLVAVTGATDLFTLTGSGTKTVKVTRLSFVGTVATASVIGDLTLLKRSTANTGGTSTNPTKVPHDSNNAAATATVNAYTANPTTGTLVGAFANVKFNLLVTGGGSVPPLFTWDWGVRPEQAPTLRGTGDVFAVNLNATAFANATTIDISISWSEES